MLRVKLNIGMGLIIAAITSPAVIAQQAQSLTSKPSNPDSDYVSEKGFKNKIFDIKHRDPNSLVEVLRLLGSGFKGAMISVNQEFKTITVRDFPENIAVIEDALGRLDVAEAPRPDIEFRIYLLVASSTQGATTDYPTELNDVVEQLRTTFKYKDYGLMTSSVVRTKGGAAGINNKGVAEPKRLTAAALPHGNPIFYNYDLRPISLDLTTLGRATTRIGTLSFDIRIPIRIGTEVRYENIGFKTPVNIREGEKVVVGTTTMEDKGLILVLSARVIK